MADFGQTTIYGMLLLAAWACALALVGATRKEARLVHAARVASYAVAGMATLSILVLSYSFAASDFAIQYVQKYSDRGMPMFYKLTAVWGGQSGSLLFWAWLLAMLTALAVHINHRKLGEILPWFIAILMAVMIFFCVLMLLTANPFDVFLVQAPTSGQGLNPLLQNAYMVTHPPSLYVGYVGMTIPFALAVASLIAGVNDERWLQAARPFALAAWYFLTMGLLLGMIWAYEELGWGGYWAWDPVENAGLIPWFTGTALMHSMMAQNRRGLLKAWTVALAIISFVLTIFGTFITRSGLIDSVHAFAKSNIGWYFLAFMFLTLAASAALMIKRRDLLRGDNEQGDLFSREYFFMIYNWLLLIASLMVILMTLWPTLTALVGDKQVLRPEVFNRWMTPIGLALLFITGVGPLLNWRKTSATVLRRQLALPVAVGVLTGVALYLAGFTHFWAVITLALSALALAAMVQILMRSARTTRRWGAVLVHAGIVMMYIGFAGEAYKVDKDVEMGRGDRAEIERYTVRYDGAEMTTDQQKRMLTTTLSVYMGAERLGTIHPARWIYFKHENQPTTEVGIHRTLRDDLFVAFGSWDQTSGRATFKLIVNPLVNWIWIGFILLSVGAVLASIPMPARRKKTLRPARAGGDA